MNVRSLVRDLAVGFIVLCAGCQNTRAEEASGASVEALGGERPGVVLRDEGLSLSVTMQLREMGPSWKGYLKQVVATRGGTTFRAYCDAAGEVDAVRSQARLWCREYTKETLEEESLRFEIVEEDGLFTVENVLLQGDELRRSYLALVGRHGTAPFVLTSTTNEPDRTTNPFVAVREANTALQPLVGRSFYDDVTQTTKPAASFRHSLTTYFTVDGQMAFGGDAPTVGFRFSMVDRSNDVTSRFLSPPELLAEAEAALSAE